MIQKADIEHKERENLAPAQRDIYDQVIANKKGHDDAMDIVRLVDYKQKIEAETQLALQQPDIDPAKAQEIKDQLETFKQALIAKDAYFDKSIQGLLPEGVQRFTADQIRAQGLDPSKFSNKKSGFFAALYFDENNKQVTLANRGTDDLADLVTDVRQANGRLDAQYQEAIDLGVEVATAFGNRVTFTGHSLGGGLASAQALSTRLTATTFNAAGLHPETAVRNKIDLSRANELVKAYYIKGELVSTLQDNPVFDLIGGGLFTPVNTVLDIGQSVFGDGKPNFGLSYLPEAVGNRVPLTSVSGANGVPLSSLQLMNPMTRLNLHYQNSVIESLGHGLNQLVTALNNSAVSRTGG